jgi:hypothetical protein
MAAVVGAFASNVAVHLVQRKRPVPDAKTGGPMHLLISGFVSTIDMWPLSCFCRFRLAEYDCNLQVVL